MKKLGNKGFVLAETLIVSTFIAVIFAIMYNNFYPLMGEYEKREVYDDIDSKYAAYWIKRIIQDDMTLSSATDKDKVDDSIYSLGYYNFTCYDVYDSKLQDTCFKLIDKLQIATHEENSVLKPVHGTVPHIYLTKYSLGAKDYDGRSYQGLKSWAKNSYYNGDLSGRLIEYIDYLPEYNKYVSLNGAKYRVVIEFDKKKEAVEGVDEPVRYYAYSTIEVKKYEED